MNTVRSKEYGGISGTLLAVILLSVTVVGLTGTSIWLYTQYSDYKTNVDSKVAAAEAEARREQGEIDLEKFTKKENALTREFVGPDDYGRVTFNYPKTWSSYIGEDGSSGRTYAAYFNPVTVPPVGGKDQRFAFRVLIEDKEYDQVVKQYAAKVKTGDLRSGTISTNGVSGVRYDGLFSKSIRGSVAIFKMRDKTLSLFTDANTFKPYFEDVIKTMKYNQ